LPDFSEVMVPTTCKISPQSPNFYSSFAAQSSPKQTTWQQNKTLSAVAIKHTTFCAGGQCQSVCPGPKVVAWHTMSRFWYSA